MRMHLIAKVPNEGARRLAWVIGDRFAGDVHAFARKARVLPTLVDRLLSGDVAPGTDLALSIGVATKADVSRHDWSRRPVAGWFDRPEHREPVEFKEQETRGFRPPWRPARAGETYPPLGVSPAPVRNARQVARA